MRAVGGSSGIETTQGVVMVVSVKDSLMVRIDFATSLEDAKAGKTASSSAAARPPLRASPPSRRIRQPPPDSRPVTSTTVEGMPGQLAAVDREVGAADDLEGHLIELATARARR